MTTPRIHRAPARLSPALSVVLVWLGMLAGVCPLPMAAAAQQMAPIQESGEAQDSTETRVETAEARDASPDPRYDSPRSTVATLLRGVQALDGARGERRETVVDELIGAFEGLDRADRSFAVGTIVKFTEALGRIERIDLQRLPDARSVQEQNLRQFVLFPDPDVPSHAQAARLAGDERIVLVRMDDGRWLFDRRTVEEVNDLWLAVRSLPLMADSVALPQTPGLWVRINIVPETLQGRMTFGLEPWQWIGLLVVIFLGLALDLSVRGVLTAVWLRIVRDKSGDASRETLKKTVRPFGLLVAAIVWYWCLPLLDLPQTAQMILQTAARVVLTLSSLLAAYRVVDLLSEFFASKASRTRTKFDDLLVPLLRKTAKVFITAMAVVYIAESMHIEILPLLTGLGIGGLAFAFAAKDTIENFFGSIAVIADRPFEVGDWVKIGDTEGTVEELGFRSTRIRTFYNSLVTVPNATLVRATVDNYGRRRYRRYVATVQVTYSTAPDRIDAFCEGIRELVRRHPYTRKDYHCVYLNNFGAHSLDIMVYIFFECPDWPTELRERHRFISDIVRLAHRLGVEFAFPTQTLHLRRDAEATDGEGSDADVRPGDAEFRSIMHGREAARGLAGEWGGGRPPPVTFDGKPPTRPGDEKKVGTETTES